MHLSGRQLLMKSGSLKTETENVIIVSVFNFYNFNILTSYKQRKTENKLININKTFQNNLKYNYIFRVIRGFQNQIKLKSVIASTAYTSKYNRLNKY